MACYCRFTGDGVMPCYTALYRVIWRWRIGAHNNSDHGWSSCGGRGKLQGALVRNFKV
ncbi:hypothetical protein K440DRAFT_623110 [Wilcoxina mikolae CBS 423.85]|nr:hypothetical protein K440DRAFT_623110 [Wilcoxina mikolae CBS 423.85]